MPIRPMPEDFLTHVATESNQELRTRYRCSGGALARWLRDCNIPTDRRPVGPKLGLIPADFREKASYKYTRELMTEYGVSLRTVRNWKARLGIVAPAPRRTSTPPLAAPAEFAKAVRTMTRNQLKVHFERYLNTIDRWCKEVGLKPMPTPRKTSERSATQFAGGNAVVFRDQSEAGRAADYLRRYGPVVRCNSRGVYDPNGMNWRRGSTVLEPQDVIERAQRLGWAA